jgi:hypothetical protein
VIILFLVMIALAAGIDVQTITLGEAVDNTILTWTTGGVVESAQTPFGGEIGTPFKRKTCGRLSAWR